MKDYDVIVVGAGPAGSTAALYAARSGLRVLLLERGPYPGSKNIGGGALYAQCIKDIVPDLERAPYERVITRQEYWFMEEESAVVLGYNSARYGRPPYNRLAVLKARFDPWYAQKAVEVGALLLTGHKVDALLFDGEQVVGVRIGSPAVQDIYAPITILAEGAAALLAQKAGLVSRLRPEHMSLYVKEIIRLPARVIESRFNLQPGQGAVIGLLGYSTLGFEGTSSLYTNRDSIGINAGSTVQTLKVAGVHPYRLLERIKNHPLIAPLIAGGRSLEYTSHLIPDGGYRQVPQLYRAGLLLAGDVAGMVNGIQGINLAMTAGKMAAETSVEALRKGDISERGLKLYRDLLEGSYVLKDLRANRGVPGLYNRRPYLFDVYTGMANSVAQDLTTVAPIPKREKRRAIWRKMTQMRPLGGMIRDFWDAFRVSR
ncbi:MAG: FAD-dependent oxidoreductase [Firmicutes bacterium]|nr:FAD-dependent oxidoreductase [Bacillota bacterium]